VADLLKKEIAEIVLNDLNDPRISFVSITDVEVTSDLKLAKVYFSVLDPLKEKETLQILTHSKGFIKKELAKRVTLKFLPDLVFRLDESIKYGNKIDKILKEVKDKSSGT
jgi:ribosome-binding factor A